MTDASIQADVVAKFQAHMSRVRQEIAKVIVGQDDVVEKILIAILCRGHAIMVGVPGLGKTLLVNTISKALGLHFSRIQFTPDLLPSDIVGTEIIQDHPGTGRKELTFIRGPVFTNLLLADEINRTPPKTQAALLEAMQERHVTYAGKTLHLPEPFFVLATQNPIEQEGTYNLPEAQLDRFFFMLNVTYPSHGEELEIMRRFTRRFTTQPEIVLSGEDIARFQALVEEVLVRDDISQYVLSVVRATRVSEDYALPYCRQYLAWGAGPRASMAIVLAAKAKALFAGRSYVNSDDVRGVCVPVLCHRLVTNYAAISEGIRAEDVVRKVLEGVPGPAAQAAPVKKG